MLKDANKISKTRIITVKVLENINIYGFKDAFFFILKNIVPFFICKMYVFHASMKIPELAPELAKGEPSAIISAYLTTLIFYIVLRVFISIIEYIFKY